MSAAVRGAFALAFVGLGCSTGCGAGSTPEAESPREATPAFGARSDGSRTRAEFRAPGHLTPMDRVCLHQIDLSDGASWTKHRSACATLSELTRMDDELRERGREVERGFLHCPASSRWEVGYLLSRDEALFEKLVRLPAKERRVELGRICDAPPESVPGAFAHALMASALTSPLFSMGAGEYFGERWAAHLGECRATPDEPLSGLRDVDAGSWSEPAGDLGSAERLQLMKGVVQAGVMNHAMLVQLGRDDVKAMAGADPKGLQKLAGEFSTNVRTSAAAALQAVGFMGAGPEVRVGDVQTRFDLDGRVAVTQATFESSGETRAPWRCFVEACSFETCEDAAFTWAARDLGWVRFESDGCDEDSPALSHGGAGCADAFRGVPGEPLLH